MTPPPFSPVPSSLPDLVGDHDHENDQTISDFNDLFDFDGFASDSHSPSTIPNRTPSPFRTSFSPFRSASPHFGGNAIASGSGSVDEVKVKEEPMDWDHPFGFGGNELGIMPAPPIAPVPAPVVPEMNFNGLPKDQQDALQQLMMNIFEYQNTFGTDMPADVPVQAPTTIEPSFIQPQSQSQPTTIEPSLVFSSSPTTTYPSATASGSNTSYATPALPSINENDESISEDELRSVEAHELAAPGPSRLRQSSVHSDISSRLERLAPREAIFSAGKGKGGKKGGGLSSVVRGDDEDLDDDDSWRPSPEEYKKLSSKEKRQLRNKLSARAFRTRRKDYIGTLEGHIKDRDDVIDEMRSELISSKNENRDLRQELEALKAQTMKVLHPESATQISAPPIPGLLNTLALSPSIKTIPAKRTASPSPRFNPRKDFASSSTEASRGFWGQNDMFGGSTICHHTFVPPPTFKQANLNPLLNQEPLASTTPTAASSKDISMPFHEWSENNQFNLRSMDSYRMQIWSRLTREAQAEKDNVPVDMRPKFYVESKPALTTAEASLAAHLASTATSHITSKLSASFWSAFSQGQQGLDTDKLTAVVTGTAKLSVVPNEPKFNEKEGGKSGVLDEEGLSSLMGGLKLQTGGAAIRGVRENPMGVFSNFIKSASCPARA